MNLSFTIQTTIDQNRTQVRCLKAILNPCNYNGIHTIEAILNTCNCFDCEFSNLQCILFNCLFENLNNYCNLDLTGLNTWILLNISDTCIYDNSNMAGKRSIIIFLKYCTIDIITRFDQKCGNKVYGKQPNNLSSICCIYCICVLFVVL